VLDLLVLAITLRTDGLNIKKIYMVLTLRLCFFYGPQNKQLLLPYTTLAEWFCITEVFIERYELSLI
jgi:hypothetical protein